MADQIMTAATQMDAIIPEVWSAAWYPTLLAALPFNSVVARDYEGDIKALGDIVNITTWPEFDTAEDIQEDQRVDANAVTASNTQLTINKQTVKDYIVTDRARVQSIEHGNKLRDLAFYAIQKQMQANIIAATVPSASSPDHAISFDSGTTLALADILEAKELLDEQNVPDDGSRQMIIGSEQWNDLFNISGFTSRDYIPTGSPMSTGMMPALLVGFQPKMTTVAADVSYLFHPQYMEMAVQKSLEVKVFDQGVEGRRSQRVNSSVLYGVVQASNLRVVTIS